MKQKTAFDILKTGRNVFLTGSAGTGKTFLLNKYIKYLSNRRIKPVVLAPTGIAASHINGMTIHSFFGLGVNEKVSDGLIKFLLEQNYIDRRLKDLKVLIIDEVSMVSPDLFESIDRILKKFKNSTQPFGGVQVVLSGDFFQLPPISKSLREEKFVWQTLLWESSDFKICYLQEKFRQNDSNLIKVLDEIRSGFVSPESMQCFEECYQREFSVNFEVTKLYTHNADVDKINQTELDKLDDEEIIFDAEGSGAKKHQERIYKTSLVTPELKLKIGASVIFIKNNYDKGFINGTLGKVISFDQFSSSPIVEIFSGRKIVAEKEQWEVENDKGKIQATVKQVPLRLAWALTVHKSQGMTLDAAEIDLSKTFEVGQGYVALSRISSIKGLRLIGLNEVALSVDKAVLKNDSKMQKISELNEKKVGSFSKEEKEKMFKEFLLKNNGLVDRFEIEENKRNLKKEFKNKYLKEPKEKTIDITKRFLEEKKSLAEIVKSRGIKEKTVLGHLEKIKKNYPDFDFSYLKPDKKTIKEVERAVKEIRRRKNKEDYLENGKMRVKAIYLFLKEKIAYQDINLSLILGEIKL